VKLYLELRTLLDEKVVKDSENVGNAVGTLALSWKDGTLLDEKIVKDSENVGNAVGTLALSWNRFEKLSYLVIV